MNILEVHRLTNEDSDLESFTDVAIDERTESNPQRVNSKKK